MSKLMAIVLLLMTCISASAQEWSEFFSKYKGKKGIESVYISPDMFQLIGRLPEIEVLDDDINISSAVLSLKGLYVLESENAKISEALLSDVGGFVRSRNMKLIMSGIEDDEKSEIYTLTDGDNISCMVFLSIEDHEKEVDVIVLEGNISKDNLNKLINKSKK